MLLDVSSIKGFLIIRHHKMRAEIVMPSLYYCIPLYLSVNLAALESGRCFLPRLLFFFLINGFNTQSEFRVRKKTTTTTTKKTDYLIASGQGCVNKMVNFRKMCPLAKKDTMSSSINSLAINTLD